MRNSFGTRTKKFGVLLREGNGDYFVFIFGGNTWLYLDLLYSRFFLFNTQANCLHSLSDTPVKSWMVLTVEWYVACLGHLLVLEYQHVGTTTLLRPPIAIICSQFLITADTSSAHHYIGLSVILKLWSWHPECSITPKSVSKHWCRVAIERLERKHHNSPHK